MPSKLAVASPLLLLPFRVFLPVLAHSAFIPFFFHLELLVLCLLSCFFSPSFGRRKRQTEGAQSAIYMVSFDVAVPCHTYPYSTLHSLIRCFIPSSPQTYIPHASFPHIFCISLHISSCRYFPQFRAAKSSVSCMQGTRESG